MQTGTLLPQRQTHQMGVYRELKAREAPHLRRGTAGPGDLNSLGAAVIARLDEKLYLLALCQAAEALGDDAGLHSASTIRRHTW